MFELLLAASAFAAPASAPAAPLEVVESREALEQARASAERELERFLAMSSERDGLEPVQDAYREIIRRLRALDDGAHEHRELVNSHRYTKGLRLLSSRAPGAEREARDAFAWARQEDVFLERQEQFRWRLLEEGGPHLKEQEDAYNAARRRGKRKLRLALSAAAACALAAAGWLALRWARAEQPAA